VDQELARILEDCLQQLAAGESMATCARRYPERAAELAPMLAAAQELTALQASRLSEPARARAKVALRQALADQQRGHASFAWGLFGAGRASRPLAGIAAILLFLSLAAGTVAASRPGDPPYRIRVAVEQAPAWFQVTPAGRIAAELRIADRRAADLSSGRYDPIALQALLAADEDAAARAAVLSPEERAEVATRVTAHARILARLAQSAPDPRAANALQVAGQRAYGLAEQLERSPAQPTPRPTPESAESRPAGTGGPQETPGPSAPPPTGTREPGHTPSPTGEPSSGTGSPQHTPEPSVPSATGTGGSSVGTPLPVHTPQRTAVPPTGTGQPPRTPGGTGDPQRTREPSAPPPTRTVSPQHTPEGTGAPRRTPEPTAVSQPTPEATGGPQRTPEPSAPPPGGTAGPPEGTAGPRGTPHR
jgi:hypothetical protein